MNIPEDQSWTLEHVTRVDVVADGRCREFWADEWDVYIQDGGRTLKLVARGDGVQARSVRQEELRRDLRTFDPNEAGG